ncbi:UNVERIFIED_CONTAM: pde-5 [Trichonephila clavipes]
MFSEALTHPLYTFNYHLPSVIGYLTTKVSFLKGICIPCYELLYSLIPETKPMLDGCRENLNIWESLAEERKKSNASNISTEESSGDEKDKTNCSKIM